MGSRTLILEALISAKVELEYLVKVAEANRDNGPTVRGHKETLELIGRALQALPQRIGDAIAKTAEDGEARDAR